MDFVNSRYSDMKEIHSSLQSTIMEALDIQTGCPVVLKRANQNTEGLRNEIKMYRHLQAGNGLTRIPRLLWTEEFEGGPQIITLTALGPNLEYIFNSMGRRMSLKTLLTLAEQMIECIKQVHKRGVLHCDVRPENFLIGRGKAAGKLFLIGFSHAQFADNYVMPATTKRFCRRASYQSLQTHLGCKYGYRDDLESIGLVLVYFHEGLLPWQGILVEEDEKRFELMARVKSAIRPAMLCQNLPKCFENYFELCQRLEINEWPNHRAFRKIFQNLFVLNKFRNDLAFDWSVYVSSEPEDDTESDYTSENTLCGDELSTKTRNLVEISTGTDTEAEKQALQSDTTSQVLAKALLDSARLDAIDEKKYILKLEKENSIEL